jgi:predicted ATPase
MWGYEKMIKSLTLKNIKSIKNQTYEFMNFDLLVGRNNCGKSTILQALAIWQYCVDEFHRTKRSGTKGIQIVLPNFTALPLPEFNLLWTDKTERQYPKIQNKVKQEFILIEIIVKWDVENKEEEFGVSLRYQSPQAIIAKPIGGWAKFRELEEKKIIPKLVYVPPFSGLEPFEEWRDDSILKKQVGKAQPGSVLRNLLYRVVDKYNIENGKKIDTKENKDWEDIKESIKKLFSVDLKPPKYEKGIDTQITCTYKNIGGDREFDIISGGSGFHQTLTLLAFLYGYEGLMTILFDEPDAHMHTNLQRETLDFFKKKARTRNIQFIIATHSEELIRGVEPTNIISVLSTKPERIKTTPSIVTALSEISNLEITHIIMSPFILYIEGENDERILRAWANILEKNEVLNKYYFKIMGGGNKNEMKNNAKKHFDGLKQLRKNIERKMLVDFDSDKTAFHPGPKNKVLFEWKRKNIENYLLVKDAWHRSVINLLNIKDDDLFLTPFKNAIDDFFTQENLTLPPKTEWRNLNANVFKIVNGKGILFENDDSLFQRLKIIDRKMLINRDVIASNMQEFEMHQDILDFFSWL